MREALGRRLRDPIFWNDALQLLKTAVAAVIAWVLAAAVFDLPQPFLAPWAALLVVHATVYRTFSQGAQQVAATVVGVLLAAAVGNVLGLDTGAVAVLLVVALTVGQLPWFGAEATTIAATAVVVLTTGFEDDTMLISRLLDTGIGVAVGLLVNVLVWPPLRRRTAVVAMDQIDDGIGQLLEDIGDALREGWDDDDVSDWIERSRSLDGDLDHAWALVRQAQESARMNPRRSAGEVRDPQQWHQLLRRMEQAVAETRSMARTLGGQVAGRWDADFARPWGQLVSEAGRAAADADAEAIRDLRVRLERLVEELTAPGRLSPLWPVHGGLVINLRNILDAMDDVAAANPLGQPPVPLARLRRRVPVPPPA
jgi:uncharacterized membrane protein YgaE (UPF0421/DUF939 family)